MGFTWFAHVSFKNNDKLLNYKEEQTSTVHVIVHKTGLSWYIFSPSMILLFCNICGCYNIAKSRYFACYNVYYPVLSILGYYPVLSPISLVAVIVLQIVLIAISMWFQITYFFINNILSVLSNSKIKVVPIGLL